MALTSVSVICTIIMVLTSVIVICTIIIVLTSVIAIYIKTMVLTFVIVNCIIIMVLTSVSVISIITIVLTSFCFFYLHNNNLYVRGILIGLITVLSMHYSVHIYVSIRQGKYAEILYPYNKQNWSHLLNAMFLRPNIMLCLYSSQSIQRI